MADITVLGTPARTSGQLPAPGSEAPDFLLTDKDLNDVTLATYAGRRKVLNIVPSLDTPTCQTSTRRFNAEASHLPNTVVLVISADLPFAQQRFCSTEGLAHVVPLSIMRSRAFAEDYGVLILDGALRGITARAVVVLDENNSVRHAQLVSEIADEPDYAAALAVL